ncbi:hypothetical protein A3A68_01065 [Candidatus Saccharibacteria bacterium RIFCSPLOWO2_01_FULL_48_13]|nr:MAG: hypothetical protein A3F38_02680 [Candidatus Saccharibacteria bacterium RIFCSPHIGHO2_12_FULL_48_21]OGL37029.1 MAG: hypothetical protein A3A68_01065 [Candidatus Saccharibacteria bacterium RIFCSPLOWO2_01_FULL_48_13]
MKSLKRWGWRLLTAVIVSQLAFSSMGAFGGKVLAACTGNNYSYFSGGYNSLATYYSYMGRVGGVSLDQAATFMEDMSDVTGAYFDQTTNRIVLVGPKLGSGQTPVFNKDDLAVAVKSIVFNNTLPSVDIGASNPTADPLAVTYSVGIENTNFGYTLEKADLRMKKLSLGTVSSSVSGYKSLGQRILDQNPTSLSTPSGSRMWISPQTISLKRDTTNNSFVFDQVVMQVQNEALYQNNDPKWTTAVNGFTQHFTTNYDAFAQEYSYLAQTKELAKIAGVVKWIKDNNIITDFTWAKNYTPATVATPSSEPLQTSQTYSNQYLNFYIQGGVNYSTPNSYTSDNGTSSAMKTASEGAAPSREASHWEFTQSNQDYVSVAVAANAFRSVGSYTTAVTDMSFDVQGDIDLEFTRAYSSLTAGQSGVGRGWDAIPARLYSIQPWNTVSSSPQGGYSGIYPVKVAFQTLDGTYETYTYNSGTGVYAADQSYYHTKLLRNTDGSYTVTMKDQRYYKFNISMLVLMQRDKNNNGVFYQYDTQGSDNITRISDINNHDLTLTYNSDNRISSVKDWTNRTVSYGYDSSGRLTTVTDPRSNAVTYAYDSDNRLTSITDRLNHQIFTASYNDKDKMTTSTTSSGLSLDYEYDEDNRIVTATDDNQRESETHYDDRGRTTKQVDPLNNEVEYTYGSEVSPLTVTDKNNNQTTFTYDSNGNTASVTYPDSKQVTFTYNSQNFVTQISDGRYGGTPKVTSYTYDSAGNPLTKTEAGVTTTYTYNGSGLLATATDPLSHTSSYQYNNFGSKTIETDPTAAATTYTYDSLNRLTQQQDASGKTMSFTYDGNNNVLTAVDSVGTTTNVYNAENKLTSTTTPDNKTTQFGYNNSLSQTGTTDALTNLTSYGYDDYQNLTSRQDALNHTTEYVYDELNRKKESETPLGKVKKWFYDANGNITKRTDESNRDTTYAYNNMNRLTQITYPDSSTVTYTYDDRGNATQITGVAGTTTYSYDTHDRLTSVTDPHNSTVSYGYDNADNLTTLTYPDSKAVNYKYDAANRLKSVTDWNSSKTYLNYNPNGMIQSKQLQNGIFVDYGYDNANRLSSVQYSQNQSLITKFNYTRDSRGNVTNETESKPSTISEFTVYDEALTSGWSKSWSWDSTINLTDTTNPYAGTKNISWQTTAAWAGMHVRKSSGTFSTTPYTAITFAMKSTQANQKVLMTFKDANDDNLGPPVDISVYGGHPVSSGYKVYTIPLAAFNAANTSVLGFTLEDDTGSSQPKMYIDSIKFTTATPSSITLYDDAVAPEFVVWKWNGTENLADTTQPFQGTKDISLTGSAGWSGIQLHHDGDGFTTKGSSALRFALKGSQAGQDYTVQLTDDTGTGLGNELDIAGYAGRADASDYTVYTIPLTDLSASNVTTFGFILQNQNNSAQPAILIDDIKIIPATTSNVTNTQSTFTYDSVNRLLSATHTYGTYTYTYDAVGNRSTSNENGTNSTYTHNNDNQMTAKASRTFSYDNQGNETADGSKTLAYDFDNRLKTYTSSGNPTVNYVYDGSGNRIEKNNTGSTSYHFVNDLSGDLSRVLVNKNMTASTNTFYVYAGGLISQGDSSASSRQYYLDDGLGNVRYTTNNTGGNVQTYTYDPYGNIVTGSDSNFSFQEQEKDSENGLMYLRARYYDPTTGNFTSRDPIDGELTNPQSQNGYNYTNDNPVNMTDPSGEFAFIPLLIAGALYAWTAYDAYHDVQNCNYGSAAIGLGLGFVPGGKIAQTIAKGHAIKHIGDFTSIGVKNQTQFANHIQNVISKPSAAKQLERGRVAYWDQKTSTVVIYDPLSLDFGTAFKSSKTYFNSLK